MSVRDTAAQLGAMALALGVGVLIGARACGPQAPVAEGDAGPVAAPAPRIVYQCPPDVGVADASPDVAIAAAPKNKTKRPHTLPKANGPSPAEQRRRLLAWAQDKSDGLIGCRTSGGAGGSVIVTLHLDTAGALDDVVINTASNDSIPANTLACARARIRKWHPPAELVGNRQKIVFGLDL